MSHYDLLSTNRSDKGLGGSVLVEAVSIVLTVLYVDWVVRHEQAFAWRGVDEQVARRLRAAAADALASLERTFLPTLHESARAQLTSLLRRDPEWQAYRRRTGQLNPDDKTHAHAVLGVSLVTESQWAAIARDIRVQAESLGRVADTYADRLAPRGRGIPIRCVRRLAEASSIALAVADAIQTVQVGPHAVREPALGSESRSTVEYLLRHAIEDLRVVATL